ncbi:MAG TPA: ABC transporter permease [Blastocatellia bacterium]|nr:ABC transporter permease [Blastocatellia bacterium]
MLHDIRFGLRLLWKEKAFALAALLTLALCIGANTTIFTVLNSIVLKELPFPESDRLVMMYNLYPGIGVSDRGANSVPDYLDRRKLVEVFEDVSLVGFRGYDVGTEGSPRRISGMYVTPSYLRILKATAILGRVFTDDEAIPGKDRVVILSEALWGEMFARDPGVIGRDIRLSGVPYSIVGVAPDTLRVMNPATRLWVPFAFTPEQTSDDARYSDSWGMIARLKPDATIMQATRRIETLNKQNLEQFPKHKGMLENARFQTKVAGMKSELVRDIKDILYLLQAAVFCVLLIGCVNLANLMLVRANSRLKEFGVRFVMGAGRWQLSRQILIESLTISVLGGLLGIGIALGGVQALASMVEGSLPGAGKIQIDGEVLAMTIMVTVLTGLGFSGLPLLSLFRRNLSEVFRGNERGGTAGRQALSLRATLVVTQVSLTFILLIGSGLLTLSFRRLLTVDPGFRAENVATARFSLPQNLYKEDAQRRNFISALLEKARSIPGVRYSGVTDYLPFASGPKSIAITIEGITPPPGGAPPAPGFNTIDSGYLQTMGIPLLAGRNFSDSDGPDSVRVALVDHFMARKYWPNGDPIGARLHEIDSKDIFTVIGVVGSVKTGDLAEQNPVGLVYCHYKQNAPRSVHAVLRGETDQISLTNGLRRELASLDPEIALFDTKMMPERLSESLLNRRAAMVLCFVFAVVALLLSAIAIYGVLAYSVAQRRREIGIRMALGAKALDVLRIVLGQGLKVTGIGLAIGAAVAFFLTRAMMALLYDVRPHDPLVFLATGALLAVVALIASIIPASRASRVAPSEALRHE